MNTSAFDSVLDGLTTGRDVPPPPAPTLPSSVEVAPVARRPKRVAAIMPPAAPTTPEEPEAEPAPLPTLAADVSSLEATLAASLGVRRGPDGYVPDHFLQSIKGIHDALIGVKDALTQRQSEMDIREAALDARERAVQTVEGKQAVLTALTASGLLAAPVAPRAGFRLPWGR